MPFRFRLIVDTLAVDTWCEIRHQRENRVGVMFVGAEPGVQAVVDKLQSRIVDADDWQGRGARPPSSTPPPEIGSETLRMRVFRRLNTTSPRR